MMGGLFRDGMADWNGSRFTKPAWCQVPCHGERL